MVDLKVFLSRFLFVFIFLYVFFHLPEYLGFVPDFLFPLKFFVAFVSSWVLGLIGLQVVLEGLTISSGAIDFTIVSSCTGVVSFSIFAGLLFATPMKNKWPYLLLSLPFFVFWNVFRVSLTLSFGDALVEVLHNGFWMLGVFLILGVYLFVLRREDVYLG